MNRHIGTGVLLLAALCSLGCFFFGGFFVVVVEEIGFGLWDMGKQRLAAVPDHAAVFRSEVSLHAIRLPKC
jgi:hypothetical protein